MSDLVTFEIAKKLKEKGFNEGCEYTFYNNYRVRDEIYEKHPGLSDDGYEDLRKKYGGPYKDEEVYGYYIEPLKLYSRNSTIDINSITNNELCSCPNIYQVLKWLRKEKKISVEVGIHCSLKWMCTIYGFSGELVDFTQYTHNGIDDTVFILYETYEQAALAGIEYAIDNLI